MHKHLKEKAQWKVSECVGAQWREKGESAWYTEPAFGQRTQVLISY